MRNVFVLQQKGKEKGSGYFYPLYTPSQYELLRNRSITTLSAEKKGQKIVHR